MLKSAFTLEEAVAMIMEQSDGGESESEIAILPPHDNENVSDNEAIDEDALEEVIPGDVCGELEVTLKLSKTESTHEDSDEEEKPKRSKRRKKSEKPEICWKKRTDYDSAMDACEPKSLTDVNREIINLSPFEMFLKIFDSSYLTYLADMTNLYAAQKLSSFCTDSDELLRFFGILLLSGYHHVPKEDHYWSTAEDLSNNIIPKVMPRRRFREVKRFFHLVDNANLEEGKAAKVAPFYRHLSTKFQEIGGVFSKHLCIDKSMVPYHGHHSCKIFIQGKPIRFGYKVWMMCSPDGYPFSMEIHTGTNKAVSEATLLGMRVVKGLSSVVENPNEHCLYFNNSFTSHALMKELTSMGFRAIGTVRESQTGHCPLVSTKDLRKKKIGDYDYQGDGEIVCVRWKDNSIVTVMSNCEGVFPTLSVSRFSSQQKRNVTVQQPYMIALYNKHIGGVDVLDRLLGSYRPSSRSKKWWWNLFTNGLNMAVVAAWRLHCHSIGAKALSHLEFRRQIAVVAMKAGVLDLRDWKGGPFAPVLNDNNSAEIGHNLSSTTQGRCRVCQKNTKKWCNVCKKRMHEPCFFSFHK